MADEENKANDAQGQRQSYTTETVDQYGNVRGRTADFEGYTRQPGYAPDGSPMPGEVVFNDDGTITSTSVDDQGEFKTRVQGEERVRRPGEEYFRNEVVVAEVIEADADAEAIEAVAAHEVSLSDDDTVVDAEPDPGWFSGSHHRESTDAPGESGNTESSDELEQN